MNAAQHIETKAWGMSMVLVFFLLLVSYSKVAIPGPIPNSLIEGSHVDTLNEVSTEEIEKSKGDALQRVSVEKAKPISFSETIDLFRTENMNQILSGFHTGLHPTENTNLIEFISQESRQYGFEPELILALISTESSFYNWSVSNKGALGLMQIVPATGRALAKATQISWNNVGNQTLFDPYINIKLGIRYLHSLNEQFQDIHLALTAYNFGPTKVRRWIRKGKRIPTRYANKVLKAYTSYLSDNQKRVASDLATQSVSVVPNQDDA